MLSDSIFGFVGERQCVKSEEEARGESTVMMWCGRTSPGRSGKALHSGFV